METDKIGRLSKKKRECQWMSSIPTKYQQNQPNTISITRHNPNTNNYVLY